MATGTEEREQLQGNLLTPACLLPSFVEENMAEIRPRVRSMVEGRSERSRRLIISIAHSARRAGESAGRLDN
jgi:hypothetical protein